MIPELSGNVERIQRSWNRNVRATSNASNGPETGTFEQRRTHPTAVKPERSRNVDCIQRLWNRTVRATLNASNGREIVTFVQRQTHPTSVKPERSRNVERIQRPWNRNVRATLNASNGRETGTFARLCSGTRTKRIVVRLACPAKKRPSTWQDSMNPPQTLATELRLRDWRHLANDHLPRLACLRSCKTSSQITFNWMNSILSLNDINISILRPANSTLFSGWHIGLAPISSSYSRRRLHIVVVALIKRT